MTMLSCLQILSDRYYYFVLLTTNGRRSLNSKLLQILGKSLMPSINGTHLRRYYEAFSLKCQDFMNSFPKGCH
jgi:hypothetical protein